MTSMNNKTTKRHRQAEESTNLFKEKALIFFASDSTEDDKKKVETQEEKESSKGLREMSPEEKRKCKEILGIGIDTGSTPAMKIVEKFQKRQIETTAFEAVYKILKDPNKRRKDEYKNFLSALANGRFPKKAASASKLAKVLLTSGPAQKYLVDELKKLREEGAPISESREKEILDKIRSKGLSDKQIEEISEEEIEGDSKVRKAAEKATNIENENWPPELPPESEVRKINELEQKQKELFEKMLEVEKELDAELDSQNPNNEKVKKLEARMNELNKEFSDREKELEEPREKRERYMKRVENQYDVLESFFKESGVDIKDAAGIRMWLLGIVEQEGEKAEKQGEPLKLTGVSFDVETGEASKKTETLKVERVYFSREEGLAYESPGTLIIEGKNEKGERFKEGYKTFLNRIIAADGYEEIEDKDKMEDRIADETFGKSVEKGQQYIAKVPIGISKDGKLLREDHIIKIAEVDEANKKIRLEQDVKAVPKEWISRAMPPELRFDRTKKDFAYGEFVKLLKQHGYKRKVSMEEVDTTEEVIYIDENGLQRWATVKADKENQTYSVTPVEVKFDKDGDKYLAALQEAGVPMDIARKPRANLGIEKRELDNLQNLSPTDFLSMVRQGRISNAPSNTNLGRNIVGPTRVAGARGGGVPGFPDAASSQPPGEPPEGDDEERGGGKEDPDEFYKKFFPEYEEVGEGKESGDAKKRGFFKELWDTTYWMSAGDFWALGKAIWEYHVRQHERRKNKRIGGVGESIPWFDKEAKRIKKHSEQENVNQFKESFENTPEHLIEERLRQSRNLDELKAAFIVLSDKGRLRWDDVRIWKNLNSLLGGRVYIFIPSDGNPEAKDKNGKTGMDYLEDAVDTLWGEPGLYRSWYSRNNSALEGKVKEHYEKGKELISVEGGHGKYLKGLLERHKRGEYIDPHEYEGVLRHAIHAGKTSPQEVLYYVVQGIGGVNKQGKTIMTTGRVGVMNEEKSNNYPLMDYLTGKLPRWSSKEGKYKPAKLTFRDYRELAQKFDAAHWGEPGEFVDKMVWEKVLPFKETRRRVEKGLKDGENLDHEDIPYYLPQASIESVERVLEKTGSSKGITTEGLANAFPGYNQTIKAMAESGNTQILEEVINGYMKFYGIVMSKHRKDKNFYRLGESTKMTKPTVISDTPPIYLMRELNEEIEKVVNAYALDVPELKEAFTKMKDWKTPEVITTNEDKRKQQEIEQAFYDFPKLLRRAAGSDKGAKMLSSIDTSKLTGMSPLSQEEIDRRSEALEE